MQIDLSNISKYRAELMGVATIGILLCHCPAHVSMPSALKYLMFQGQFANALFLLLSGFGMYYSLTSHYSTGNTSIWSWYKRRYVRILVPYLVLKLFPGFILALNNPETDWWYYVANLSLITYWKNHDCPWFLSLLVPLYAITPLLYKSLFSNGKVLRNAICYVIPLTIIPILKSDDIILSTIIQHVPDVMVFVLGLVLGYYSQNKLKLNLIWFFAAGVFYFLMFFVQHRNFSTWYLGVNFFVFPLILMGLEHCKKPLTLLVWLGTISLESYLTNTSLPRYVKMIPWDSFSIIINKCDYFGYLIVIVGGLLWAYLIHRASDIIIKQL